MEEKKGSIVTKFEGHTPGPWFAPVFCNDLASEKGSYIPIETLPSESDGYVARVYHAGKPGPAQDIRDADLIAAACSCVAGG